MAKKIVTVCDLDNCKREDAASVELAFNSERVEIDLCPEHTAVVHDALGELLKAGRPVRQPRKRRTVPAVIQESAGGGPKPRQNIRHAGHNHPNTKRAKQECRDRLLAEAGAA